MNKHLAMLMAAALALAVGTGRAADPAQLDALVQAAEAHLAAAAAELSEVRKRLADELPLPEPDAAELVDLKAFAWAKTKKADPTGLPAGAKYGEGVAGGQRTCQWKWPDLILHAVIPATATAANGATARWYHFTTNGRPHPALAAYSWKNTHQQAEGGVVWYRWAGSK